MSTSPRCEIVSPLFLADVLKSKDIATTIHDIAYTGKVSNSEALLLAAMWGAHKEGADVELVYPGQEVPYFDGVVMATPVYFGDRSSSLHQFITETYLKNKAVGVVSSGAKRNGGQETTNIYALYDCLDKGALITGNGPPTAQYGGTGWAGNKTAIGNDDFGIKTSHGTGTQVAKLARVIGSPVSKEKTNILFVRVTKDSIRIPLSGYENSNIKIINVSDKTIKKCIGCPVCPGGDLTKDYKCIMKDGMWEIRECLIKADCIVFVSGASHSKFQTFIERTRFIRRNHFELGERVYSSLSHTDSITDILPLRLMTNMLRQNMFGLPFWKQCREYSNMNFREYMLMLEKYAGKSKAVREATGIDSEYTAVGYEDATLNEKAYRD